MKLSINKNHKIKKAVSVYEIKKFSLSSTNLKSLAKFIILKTKYKCGFSEIKYDKHCLISTRKCSCGKAGNYNYHNASFINYCPYCKIGEA